MKEIFKAIKKNNAILLLAAIVLLSVQFTFPSYETSKEVEIYYKLQIQNLKNDIHSFKKRTNPSEHVKNLIAEFYQCRVSYKKVAVLIEYFNQYETIKLNGPAINRIESEVADRIISPEGFQAIEDLLFSNWKESESNYTALTKLLNNMLSIIERLEKEPDLQYKFKDELVWDAIRSATVQLISSGITGFDSPTAKYSLPEGISTIDGIIDLLFIYKPAFEKKMLTEFEELVELLYDSKRYLEKSKNFDSFNRLKFITTYINPFYKKLISARIKSGIGIPEGRSSINYQAESIFDEDALNINFYSPPPQYWITPERIILGKKLFFDPILSGTKTRSCASCHQPDKAFTDGLAKPYALDNKTILLRNTPTLWNAGFQTKQFYDSRADILENQLGEVVHNIEEMSGSLKTSVIDLKNDSNYKKQFDQAYPNEINPINTFTLANAISSYVRSLRSLNSRFDQYMRGDEKKLNTSEKKGFNLFMGKAKCATCHHIPLFNGVLPPHFNETESEVLGVPASKEKKSAILDSDPGKFSFTGSVIHKHSFKTPTLRNISLTAPYMHNGVFNTLEEVMEFYNNGGGKGLHIAPVNQTLPFDKLNLTKKEIKSIIAFMHTLTDTTSTYK